MAPFASLVEVLAHRAATQGDERALVFLTDRGAEDSVLTFRELHDAANALAQRLADVAKPGDRALLVFPPGLEFIIAFFGCLIARVIAVPMMVPRRQSSRDSSASIMANCQAEARAHQFHARARAAISPGALPATTCNGSRST